MTKKHTIEFVIVKTLNLGLTVTDLDKQQGKFTVKNLYRGKTDEYI